MVYSSALLVHHELTEVNPNLRTDLKRKMDERRASLLVSDIELYNHPDIGLFVYNYL